MAGSQITPARRDSRIKIRQLLFDECLLSIKNFLGTFGIANRSVFIRFVTDRLQHPKFVLQLLAAFGDIFL